MNEWQRTHVYEIVHVILLAEETLGTSGDELTMPELAGREKKLMMIIYYYYYCSIVWSQQDFHTGPFLIIHASFVHFRNNSDNNEWALAAGWFVFRG